MNEDEIIKYKEWDELTAGEKLQIQELAASEPEFNLVKQIMLQAAIQEASIPPVSQKVQEHIQEQLWAEKTYKINKGWLIAAALVTIMIALFFILQNRAEKSNPVVRSNEQKAEEHAQSPDSLLVDKAIKDTMQNTFKPSEKIIAKMNDKKPDSTDTVKLDNQNYDRYISATVESDTSLLAFITKVY